MNNDEKIPCGVYLRDEPDYPLTLYCRDRNDRTKFGLECTDVVIVRGTGRVELRVIGLDSCSMIISLGLDAADDLARGISAHVAKERDLVAARVFAGVTYEQLCIEIRRRNDLRHKEVDE